MTTRVSVEFSPHVHLAGESDLNLSRADQVRARGELEDAALKKLRTIGYRKVLQPFLVDSPSGSGNAMYQKAIERACDHCEQQTGLRPQVPTQSNRIWRTRPGGGKEFSAALMIGSGSSAEPVEVAATIRVDQRNHTATGRVYVTVSAGLVVDVPT